MKPEEIRDRLTEIIGESPEYYAGPIDPAIVVPPAKWYGAALALRDLPELRFDFLRSLCGVDRPEAGVIEIVAHLFSYTHRHAIVVKTRIDRKAAELATVSDIWPAANWHERETFDLFGVRFAGHPDLRRLLLPEDWTGHPLLKDYQEPGDYQGIPTRRAGQGGVV
jgi:NADH-quinone oxidoreductase subunit C